MGAGFALTSLGGGHASADTGAKCHAANGGDVVNAAGRSSCGAVAKKHGTATAIDNTRNGTVVAVADVNSTANSTNYGPLGYSVASAGPHSQATAITFGPAGTAIANGLPGGQSYAIAGFGGQAAVTQDGVSCTEGWSFAIDTKNGKICISGGGVGWSNQ